MQCANCGCNYSSKRLFCPECGANAAEFGIPAEPKPASGTAAKRAPSSAPAGRKKRRRNLKPLLVLPVLAAAAAGIVLLAKTAKRGDGAETAVTAAAETAAAETAARETAVPETAAARETASAPVYDDGIIRGDISAFGISLLGKTADEARLALSRQVGLLAEEEITVTLPGSEKTLTLTPAQTGITAELDGLVADAYSYGRADNGMEYSAVLDCTGCLSVNEEAIRKALTASGFLKAAGPTSDYSRRVSITDEVAVTAEDGSVTYETETYPVLRVRLGRAGISFTEDAVIRAVKAAVGRGETTAKVADYAVIPASRPTAESLYSKFYSLPMDAYYDPQTLEIMPETPGWDFNRAELQALLDAASDGETVEIRMNAINPDVTSDMLEPRLTDVLGSYQSRHTANEDRTVNLTIASEKINGRILQPGEEFSFNFVVGERTVEKGYRPAIAYVNSESVPEVGGGVCQVASAIYSACLFADMEILETHVHEFKPSYGDPGMDTTIYFDHGLDYRFRNNTDYPVRIDVSVEGGFVRAAIVGTETRNYTVKMRWELLETIPWQVRYHTILEGENYRPGQVITSPYTGYTYVTYMDKYDLNGNLISSEEVRVSEYSARSKVIARNG